MIPTMILLGLVLGRWWRLALGTAAISWPLLLLATGVVGVEAVLVAAVALAVANAGVGVLVHQGCLHAYRHLGNRTSQPLPD
jgi:hypothetical protein